MDTSAGDCGNILAAVGGFAIENNLVAAETGAAALSWPGKLETLQLVAGSGLQCPFPNFQRVACSMRSVCSLDEGGVLQQVDSPCQVTRPA